MPIPILMPALSPTMEEGTLAKWHVKVGDQVKSGDVIAEIETDKATMEVEAVDEGKVGELVVPEGTENVKVNAPIAILLGEGESMADAKAAAKSAPAPTAAKSPSPRPPDQVGGRLSPRERGEGGNIVTLAPAGGEGRARGRASSDERTFASPLARRMAEQQGIDIAAVVGSGPHGRIVRRDVETAKPGGMPLAARAPAAAPAHKLPAAALPVGSYDEVPLDGMRRTIARRLAESFRDVPHFPLTIDLEIDKLLAVRKELNAKLEENERFSVNDMVIRASALALKKVPDANASFTEKAIIKHHHADISVAVAIPGGLITPIIFQAENKGLSEIAREMKDLAARARERKLKPEEFQGGTFSVSNLGMFGIKDFASIINEPQGAILSVGAGEPRPVVKNGALAIATVMSVTLTCDHRVVDGATGARWLAAFKKLIEDPMTMLL
ncbi:MAG: pyruvate dehydrogenase complex dihydrolipoamide acetyltransferase [Alphaproteobacteria bacterium]